MTGTVFHWFKEPSGHWLTELQRMTPAASRLSHLTIRWEPGRPALPVQRWMLYEMIPFSELAPVYQEGFWESEHKDSFGWRWNYAALEATGCLGTPFWVIQGNKGGHPWKYTQSQQSWMRLANKPQDPPPPGSLPYAEWDRRVLLQVMVYDRLQRAEANLKNAFAGKRADDERAVREATVKMLGETIDDAIADAKWKIPYEDLPTADGPAPDAEAAFDRYTSLGL